MTAESETHRFIRNHIIPREAEIVEADAVPDNIREQAEHEGLSGYAIPQVGLRKPA